MAPNMPSNPKGLSDAAPLAKVQKTESGFSIMAEAKPEHYHAGNKLTVLVDMDNTMCDYEDMMKMVRRHIASKKVSWPWEGI